MKVGASLASASVTGYTVIKGNRIVCATEVMSDLEPRPFPDEGNHPAGPDADGPERRGFPMYGHYYGLQEAPFDLTPNNRVLFLSSSQSEALANLRYALTSAKGFSLITGDAGTGKTTLARAALSELGDTSNRYALVSNPTLGRGELRISRSRIRVEQGSPHLESPIPV